MKNRSKDAFPSDTRKNPKDCMVVSLRSGRELESRKEEEKKKNIEIVEESKTGKENKTSSLDGAEETAKKKVQIEQQVERE